jgi:hypothetical protein
MNPEMNTVVSTTFDFGLKLNQTKTGSKKKYAASGKSPGG